MQEQSNGGSQNIDATAACCAALLVQCERFIGVLPAGVYSKPCAEFFGGTIGQHVRHALDHFAAPVHAGSTGVIDYDHRERGTTVETDPRAASAELRSLRRQVEQLDERAAARAVRVRVMLSGDGQEVELVSTLARELAFAAHHAVHHHAMIAVIAQRFGITPPAEFGKAPSTINHEQFAARAAAS